MRSGAAVALLAGVFLTNTAAIALATPTKKDFIAVMEKAEGCFVAEKDAEALFVPLGFTRDMVRPWVDELVEDGLATSDKAGLTLKTENCH